MAALPHNGRPDFQYGIVDQLSENIRRVICNNPGPFTFTGTGTYIVGTGEIAIIDPGPADEAHIEALLEATRGERITHILVTHTHTDHSPGCALLRRHCDAPTYAYGAHGSGEFGADQDFVPDVILDHGHIIEVGDLTVEAVYTPGHASNHLSFCLVQEQALFCGDVAQAYLEALYAHRESRAHEVLQHLQQGEAELKKLTLSIYHELNPSMLPAAEKSLLATLEYLIEQGRVEFCEHGLKKTYQLAMPGGNREYD